MTRRSGRGTIKKEPTLEKLGNGRAGAVDVMRQAKIGSPEYKSAGYVADAIDDLAEKLTGDRTHFHAQPASTTPKD
ncbi:hypothetical protein IWQ54_001156 [Labrenzia sp. EL_195]|nr:hypothetical protein [Labrenzia sp. EL_195]